jgi:hypothetical protein
VVEVLALAAHPLMLSGEQLRRLAPPVTPFLAVRDATPGNLEAALGLAIPAVMEDARPS